MKRPARWTALVPWLVLTWCAAVTVDHFWTPDTWARALRTGLVEIPVWVGAGFFTLRRAKRRAQDQHRTEQAPR